MAQLIRIPLLAGVAAQVYYRFDLVTANPCVEIGRPRLSGTIYLSGNYRAEICSSYKKEQVVANGYSDADKGEQHFAKWFAFQRLSFAGVSHK